MHVKTEGRADVSVVIPTYNREATVCRAIESALEQTHPPAEIIVVDDGSTDNTNDIVGKRFGDRVIYIVQENAGVAAARNVGIEHASCEFVAFLDSDDIWAPSKIECQLPTMVVPDVVLSATNWRWENQSNVDAFRASGFQLGLAPTIENLPLIRLSAPKGHRILIQSCICRRDILRRIGGFDRSLRITEDNDLIFRMADQGKFAIVPDVLLIRNDDDDHDHLTDVRSMNWHRENLDNMLNILTRSLKDSHRHPPNVRTAVKSRYATLLIERAKLAAKTGELGDARRFCLTGLRCASGLSYEFVLGLAGVAFPRILCRRGSRSPHFIETSIVSNSGQKEN